MKARVLVVDDERANRRLLRAYLDQEDYTVVEAENGDVALDSLRREPVDMVLLDVLMPGLDGYAVCRQIKAEARGFLPVILLTALNDQSDRNTGLEAGADDFLTKPVDRRELALRVRAFLRLRRQELQIVEQEARLRQQLVEMAQLQGLKDELFSLIVHDIRNPLTGLMGFVEALMDGLERRGDPMQAFATGAYKSARKVEELLATVLEVQMLESGAVPLQLAKVHLRAVVQDAIESLSGAARAMDILIDLAGDTDPEIEVDRRLVRRSVENLLANAIKYSPAKGTVEVSIRSETDAVEVAVADDGPGVRTR